MAFTAKFMAFYLLLGSFLPQSDFSQLRKMPKLVEHYEYHLAQASEIGQDFSFAEYLWIHFVQPDHHEHEDNSHQDLPLQSLGGTTNMVLFSASFALQLPRLRQDAVRFLTPSWATQAALRLLLRPPIQ